MICRSCAAPLSVRFADLGVMPLANAYVPLERLGEPEIFYPLEAAVCERCWLVQLTSVPDRRELFDDYVYFSSYSESWLADARQYVTMITDRLSLGAGSKVVEVASNDGYLLQYFVASGIPVLGIEPAANIAEVARDKGIESWTAYFGTDTARQIAGQADLIIANNVFAHVTDLHDFVEGFRIALGPSGTVTIEFPHLLRIMMGSQFDNMYHEHCSYLSLLAVQHILGEHQLEVVDVEQIHTQGGSLRVYAQHAGHGSVSPRVDAVLAHERAFGLDTVEPYLRFADSIRSCKRSLLLFLLGAHEDGKSVVGYGAPAKASTLLNYCGVRADLLEYTVDRSPHKYGKHLPGNRIPIYEPSRIALTRPDYVLLLAWNLADEIIPQMSHVRDWGGKFVVPIPRTEILP